MDKYYIRQEPANGHASEDAATIVRKRGETADIAVKPDDGRVLRCIEWYGLDTTPEPFFEKVSEALRKLFKEDGWEHIKAMDNYENSIYRLGGSSLSDLVVTNTAEGCISSQL